MSTEKPTQKPYAIVVGIDFTEISDLALERACEVAMPHRATHLHVVYVEGARASKPSSSNGGAHGIKDDDLNPASARLQQRIEHVVRRWSEARSSRPSFERLTTHVRFDPPAEAIAQLAVDVEAELVIVGTHGRRGARRFLLGSVAEGTVRLAGCDVLVVRPPDATVPMIEPACPRCLAARQASEGRDLWCAQHLEQQERRHTYHYSPAVESHQSGLLIHVA